MKKALVLSLAAVLCLGFASFAEDLFGTWDTLVCYTNVDAADCCPALSTTLIVNYEICGWTFTSTTKFNLTDGWTDQTFGAIGQVGGFVVGSTVDFNPVGALFEKWTVTTSLNLLASDLSFKFTTAAKTYTLTTNFDFGVEGCVDLILSEPTAIFGDITIDGVSMEATIGGVDFYGISYWGLGDKPGILEGTDYWEAYQITSSDDGCCGLFTFGLTVFFLQNGTQLFDIAEIDTFFDIEISEQFTLGMTLNVDLEALEYTWCLHFLVEW
jgi:hypothetical protein